MFCKVIAVTAVFVENKPVFRTVAVFLVFGRFFNVCLHLSSTEFGQRLFNFILHQGDNGIFEIFTGKGSTVIQIQPEAVNITAVKISKICGNFFIDSTGGSCVVDNRFPVRIFVEVNILQSETGIGICPFISGISIREIGNGAIGNNAEYGITESGDIGIPVLLNSRSAVVIQIGEEICAVAACGNQRGERAAAGSACYDNFFKITGREKIVVCAQITDDSLGVCNSCRRVAVVNAVFAGFINSGATAIADKHIAVRENHADLVFIIMAAVFSDGVRVILCHLCAACIAVGHPAGVVDAENNGGVLRGGFRNINADTLFRGRRLSIVIVFILGDLQRFPVDGDVQFSGNGVFKAEVACGRKYLRLLVFCCKSG